ncbi:MAG: aminotransferase class V-fold PLP-dependent enzyme [Tunicatimonas sp.]|uniref:aminotransferase class V-fold PLP-dependent enzyme n=1 Tax=Tunicatimonas sp. TaxID=1940096 RepID=UPI003C734721
MENSRRSFLHQFGALSASPFALSALASEWNNLLAYLDSQRQRPTKDIARDEVYWQEVAKAYRVSTDFINLENGYYSLAAWPVLKAQWQHIKEVNKKPSYYMRNQQWDDRHRIKQALADFAGCSVDEMVICRNTTEALDTVILGLNLEPGDEAIMTNQDYGSMLATFNQRARRDNIVNRIISLPLHPKNDQEIVDAYEQAITSQTKVMLVTHLINITGQVLPVQKICAMAHSYGVEVICDSAHALGQLDFKIQDLDCDYWGTSLHKWVGAPLGNGMLYIKKEKISQVWPLLGDDTYSDDDIRKFEHHGTLPVTGQLSILDALEFQESIGVPRKQARLRYLKQYWTEKVKDTPGVIINTPWEEERSSGIANVGVANLKPHELADRLMNKYNIFTVAIDNEALKGIRVTPHLYTSLNELDKFVIALKELASA